MSYGSGNEWRQNADAYAKFRDENKWGNDRNLGYNARKSIRDTTTRGFNDQGFSIGQGPDEIYYRMQKNDGKFTMDDVNDMITLGGKADKTGLVKVQGASDYKVQHANNLFRDVQDMAKSSQHREGVKFSKEITDWAASERERDNYENRHIIADKARRKAEREAKPDKTGKRDAAHDDGAGGTSEEMARLKAAQQKREAEQKYASENSELIAQQEEAKKKFEFEQNARTAAKKRASDYQQYGTSRRERNQAKVNSQNNAIAPNKTGSRFSKYKTSSNRNYLKS